jgi:hypothetical protein
MPISETSEIDITAAILSRLSVGQLFLADCVGEERFRVHASISASD